MGDSTIKKTSSSGYFTLVGGLSGYLTPGGSKNNVIFIEADEEEDDEDEDST